MFHGAYLSFLERARTEWLRGLGFELPAWQAEHGSILIVRRLEVAYRLPARLDDLLDVGVEVSALGRAQFTLSQQVRRRNELLVEASVNLACVTSDGLRPCALPEFLRNSLVPEGGRRLTKETM